MKTPCGIMDQFVSALACKGCTLLVDCRSNEHEAVPLSDDSVVFVVANSGVKHKHAEGAYGDRVRECQDAVRAVRSTGGGVPLFRRLSWLKSWFCGVDGGGGKNPQFAVGAPRLAWRV